MADVEEAENGTTGRLREWLSRAVRAPRDPAWTADGVVSDVWLPVSPVTGRLDAFEWRTPVEQLGGPRPDTSDDVIADSDEPELERSPEQSLLLTEAKQAPIAVAIVEAPPPASEPAPADGPVQAKAAQEHVEPAAMAPIEPAVPTVIPMAAEPTPLAMPPAPAPARSTAEQSATYAAHGRAASPIPAQAAVQPAHLRPVRAMVEPIVASPPNPDDPGLADEEEEPKRRFSLFG